MRIGKNIGAVVVMACATAFAGCECSVNTGEPARTPAPAAPPPAAQPLTAAPASATPPPAAAPLPPHPHQSL